MIEIKNVCAGYGDFDVLKDISYTLKKGENLVILGPNGCGKTTLLRVLAGLLPAKGEVTVCGMNVFSEKREAVAKKIALMSQMPVVSFGFSVRETVEMGRYAHREKGLFSSQSARDSAIVDECLCAVGMQDLQNKSVTALSGGQLQRVFLARTLCQQPQIILLDEPTNHMDLKHQAELLEYLKKWSEQENHAVVGVLHDLTLAMQLADEALLLKDGIVAAAGNVRDVFTRECLQRVYDMDLAGYMQKAMKRWESIK